MTHVGKFKIAVIGVGTGSAKDFLPEIFYSDAMKLVAVCDKEYESLKQVCEKYMVSGYRTYEDLIENEEVDFIIETISKTKKVGTKIKNQ